MSSLPRRGRFGRPSSDELRQEAARFRRRAQEEARWGSDDLAPLRVWEYQDHASRLEGWAEAAEWEERR